MALSLFRQQLKHNNLFCLAADACMQTETGTRTLYPNPKGLQSGVRSSGA
jgi:hypothetical protein